MNRHETFVHAGFALYQCGLIDEATAIDEIRIVTFPPENSNTIRLRGQSIRDGLMSRIEELDRIVGDPSNECTGRIKQLLCERLALLRAASDAVCAVLALEHDLMLVKADDPVEVFEKRR